ncbi:beta-lactamase family protein, partial [Arthrobacter sp. SO3]|uniref:beta-lactamase family protein n=1 Tax=Arthrobacter sp. SO3 TaxID=1897057 RepID=UPI001CFFD97D
VRQLPAATPDAAADSGPVTQPHRRFRQPAAHSLGAPADAEPPDPEALLRRLAGRRRAYRHPAGRSARHSNVGYLAAGEVIAAAAGMPFEAYVDQAILQPLGMEHTGFRYQEGADKATG